VSADLRDGPLAGIRVVEVGQYGSAPLASMLLADFGADVIKVEPPQGDLYRGMPPIKDGESLYFAGVNRNKRGIALDLKSDAGRDALLAVLKTADVIIENLRPGVMARLGIGPKTLLETHPHLVFCSISGYGQDGPIHQEGAYDLIIQGYSGMMAATGDPDGEPVKLVPAVPDVLSAQQAAFSILAALRARDATGRGQHIDIALLDVSLYALTLIYLPGLFGTGAAPQRLGSAHPEFFPNQAFQAGDGKWLNSGASDQRMWRGFCQALERTDLTDDPRFATNADRSTNRAELIALLRPIFRTRSRADWLTVLRENNVPSSAINDAAEAMASPQAQHRNMHRRIPHPTLGEMDMVGLPAILSATPGSVRLPPPRLGEHTAEVLREAGIDDEAIARLTQPTD
jgi:crotonobetainyl-CoA:carnitine CoA-transferase CaiB-like acyl-CoA transferase